MDRMLLALNAALYLAALSLSLCVVTPVPEGASRRVRVARMALACGGGAAITGAITLTFVGLWIESAIVGCFALVVVVVCLWVALSHSSSERDDGEDGGGGGGGKPRRPVPPAPPEPFGGLDRTGTDWSDFDAARAGWDRDRELAGV
jgi:hypothetical protein